MCSFVSRKIYICKLFDDYINLSFSKQVSYKPLCNVYDEDENSPTNTVQVRPYKFMITDKHGTDKHGTDVRKTDENHVKMKIVEKHRKTNENLGKTLKTIGNHSSH